MNDRQDDLAGDGAVEPEPEQKAGDQRQADQREIVADITQPKNETLPRRP